MPSPQPDDPAVELEAIRGRAARQDTDPYPCYDFIARDAIALAARLLETEKTKHAFDSIDFKHGVDLFEARCKCGANRMSPSSGNNILDGPCLLV